MWDPRHRRRDVNRSRRIQICVTPPGSKEAGSSPLLTSVDKYVSPGERALREEAARQADTERRKAEADDSRQRALREMMHGTLELKKELTPLENMVGLMHATASLDVPDHRGAHSTTMNL